MKKPFVLYHASVDRNIAELKPGNESPRYAGEQNLVFATPYREVAIMFLVPKDIPVEISKYNDMFVVYVNGTEAEFAAKDKGGAVYELPSNTFETDKTIGMGTTEWVSSQPVKPLSKQVFESTQQALKDNHIQIYFLSAEVFTRVQSDPSHGLEIVQQI